MHKQDPAQPRSDDRFVELLTRHEAEIRGYIRASLPSSHDVAEVMQNVSVVAWNKFALLEDADGNFAKWVCVIARFEIMKFRRGLARDRFVLDDDLVRQMCDEGEREVSGRGDEIRQLEVCLERLPKDRREIVLAAYRPGASIKELARGRGKNPDALYQLLRRIRQQLENCVLRQLRQPGEVNA